MNQHESQELEHIRAALTRLAQRLEVLSTRMISTQATTTETAAELRVLASRIEVLR